MTISLNNLETGDILLFASKTEYNLMGLFDNIIKFATKSPYTHTALVLKDPIFINPTLKGLFIWESSWEGNPDPQDGKIKLGVQITPLYEVINNFSGEIYVRKLMKGGTNINPTILDKIHSVVYDKPYDIHIKDWIEAWCRTDSTPRKTDRFWCSALVAYFMVNFGFIDKDIDWSMIRPSDLSSNSEYLKWTDCCKYSNDICIYTN